MIRSTMAAFAFAASSTIASAALVVNDQFDYGGTDLPDGYGAWEDTTGNVRYESSVTASWSGGDTDYVLVPSGGAGGSIDSNNSATLPGSRGAQLPLGSTLTGTLWVSVMLSMSSSTGTGHAVIGFENGAYSIAGFEHGGFGIRSDGSIVTTVANTVSDTGLDAPTSGTAWNLIVAKITVNNSGVATDTDDSLKLWVFDNTSSIGGQTEAALGTPTYSTNSARFGNGIADIWAGHIESVASGAARIDNLRVSDLSTDNGLKEVLTGTPVPEPASLATLAMGAIAVLRRRR